MDSRFRGNDRWVGMSEGGNDGRRGWRKDEKALVPWPRAIAFGRVAPYSWLINSSFPLSREGCPSNATLPVAKVSGFPLSRE